MEMAAVVDAILGWTVIVVVAEDKGVEDEGVKVVVGVDNGGGSGFGKGASGGCGSTVMVPVGVELGVTMVGVALDKELTVEVDVGDCVYVDDGMVEGEEVERGLVGVGVGVCEDVTVVVYVDVGKGVEVDEGEVDGGVHDDVGDSMGKLVTVTSNRNDVVVMEVVVGEGV